MRRAKPGTILREAPIHTPASQSITNALQLTHVYKGAFSTSLGYSRTTDAIVREVPGQIPELGLPRAKFVPSNPADKPRRFVNR